MFSAVGSFNGEFVPQDEVQSSVKEVLSSAINAAAALAKLGNDASAFAENADAAISILK
jgi:hypothetical protein